MIQNYYGELAALLTAIFWTFSSLAFEDASKKMGSLNVNILRLFFANFFLLLIAYFFRGQWLPTDASMHNWSWLAVSGLVGFVFGDLFLFKALSMIGARISMLIMALVPPVTALISLPILGEVLSFSEIMATALIVSGVGMVILTRRKKNAALETPVKLDKRGLVYAFLGMLGQAGGLVLSKFGMADYDPVASTQIRVVIGTIGFALIIIFSGRVRKLFQVFKSPIGFKSLFTGTFFGPVIGVTFSLISVKFAPAGVSSALMALTPVIIIIPAVLIFKEKVSFAEVLGALISVGGVFVFFLW